MMTRKDYRAFADMLSERRDYADSRAEHELLDTITAEMASIFGRDNGRFDRSKFYEAAGYNSPAADAARVTVHVLNDNEPDRLSDLRRRAY